MRKSFHTGVLAGAVATAVFLGTNAAMAGTGVGSIFNLGQTNTVNARSTLQGATGRALLQISNSGAGPAASFNGGSGAPPFRVDSSNEVPNLNADQVDGLNASDFLPANGKAADAQHADQADNATHAGSASAATVAGNAVDLGGFAASLYARTGSCVTGLVHGSAFVPAGSTFSSSYVNLANQANCAATTTSARRAGTGLYFVNFVNNTAQFGVANVEELSPTTSTCANDYATLAHMNDPGVADIPAFRVEIHDANGALEDCPFSVLVV